MKQLLGKVQHVLNRKAIGSDAVTNRSALDVFQYQNSLIALKSRINDRGDVVMAHSRQRARFSLESFAGRCGGASPVQTFESDLARELLVLRFIDASHPAGSDHSSDAITPRNE